MKAFLSSKTLLMISILLLLAMFDSSTRLAQASHPSEEKVTQALVTWTLKPENCTDLNVEVSGKGKRYQVVTADVLPSGATNLIISDFVQGTAEDTNGGKYTFIYSNQDRQRIPASGGPIHVKMTDTFLLDGPGTDNDLAVGFVWRWTFTPPEGEWPPIHNWKQIRTIGDVFNCDPI